MRLWNKLHVYRSASHKVIPVFPALCQEYPYFAAEASRAMMAASSSDAPKLDAGLLAKEEALMAEERALLARAAALERQVQRHKEAKEAARVARVKAEEREKAEREFEQWASELRSEVDNTVTRLNAQRTQQIARCRQFDDQLQQNIDQMLAMQQQVRRRATALDAAFDACVGRLSGAYSDAVARRRRQQAAESEGQGSSETA